MDAGLGGGLQWGQLTQPVGGEYNLEAQKKVLEGELESGQTVEANTLEELAEKMGVPPENLVATVDRYNELCDLGRDLDFGKRPEVMGKVVDPPFYAGKLVASMLTMCGGLRTNLDARCSTPRTSPSRACTCAALPPASSSARETIPPTCRASATDAA